MDMGENLQMLMMLILNSSLTCPTTLLLEFITRMQKYFDVVRRENVNTTTANIW